MRRLGSAVGGLVLSGGLLLGAGSAAARSELEHGVSAVSGRARTSFRERLGVAAASKLLEHPSEQRRLDGIRRLAELGTPEAHARLAALATDAKARLGGREALLLARALADGAGEARVRVALSALMHRPAPAGAGPDELSWVEASAAVAALALAEDASPEALEVLARALRAGGPSAELAALAFEAHPPDRLDALLVAGAEPSVELARLLGRLGDQRAFHRLRDWVRGGRTAELRAAAAIALTELGALETVPLARVWLKHEAPAVRAAALRMLLATQQPEATELLLAELARPKLGTDARASLLDFPRPEFAGVIRDKLGKPGEDGEFWWTLLGRIGTPALPDLARGLSDAEHGFVAAHALSRADGGAARAALSESLAKPGARRMAALAARIVEWRSDVRLDGLAAALAELGRSSSPEERAAAAWARALEGSRQAIEELESREPARMRGAANNALAFDETVFERAGTLLSLAPAGPERAAFGFALLHPSGSAHVSSRLLQELIAEGGVLAPLALRALASRMDPAPGSALERFLLHPDPELRAHAARGVGAGGRPGAVGLIESHYEFETHSVVRHAMVMALAELGGPRAMTVLRRAARLEPDAAVRATARTAANGTRPQSVPRGSESLWLRVARGEPSASDGETLTAGLVSLAPGVSLPVFADGAGLIVVAGVNRSGLGFRLQ